VVRKIVKKGEMHIRLSKKAYETFQDLEEYSGFSGSRLVEEIILSIDSVLQTFAEFSLSMLEVTSPTGALANLGIYIGALTSILDRVGYSEVYEEAKKDREKEKKRMQAHATKRKEEEKSEMNQMRR